MRIGFISNTYYPNLNGVSISLRNLVEKLQAKGHQVFLVVPKIQDYEYPDYILPVQSLPTSAEVSGDLRIPYMFINQSVEFFRKNEIQIIHSHDTMIGGAEGIVIANRLGIPAVHTYHTFTEAYPYLQIPGRTQFIRTTVKLICDSYQRIISPSSKVQKYLAELKIKTPVTQIFNVPSDIRPIQIESDDIIKLKQKYGLTGDDFVFVSFCRLAEEKSLEVGLLILNILLKNNPNIKYLIAGEGPEKKRLQRLVEYLGLTNKVVFSGRYNPHDLPEIGALSDVFVFTSFTENLPTNVLEAAQLGLPILAVDDESVDYILEPGVGGFKGNLEYLTQKALELYQDSVLREIFARNIRLAAQKFLKKDILDQHLDLYHQVIKEYQQKTKNINKESLSEHDESILLKKIRNKDTTD